jgi:hypothetical protein
MRQAFIMESFRDEYKKLLINSLFISLDSHWFVSRDSDSTELYVIRIKDEHEDIEYSIQSFGHNFEVVTDNEIIAKLITFIHQLFSTVDDTTLDRFNGYEEIGLELFSNWEDKENIEIDADGTFRVKINL